jgi:FMN-dependent NADH-azoreductase
MKLLHVDSSIFDEGSVSRVLSAEVVATQRALHPGMGVTYRDLAADPLGHLTGIHFAALKGALPADRKSVRDLAVGPAALNEFLVGNILVVWAPTYNLSIPSRLKAWIDRLAVPGETFRYTRNGPENDLRGSLAASGSSLPPLAAASPVWRHRSRSSTNKRHTCAVCSASSVSPT